MRHAHLQRGCGAAALAYYFRHYDTATELHGAPVDLFDRGVLEPKMTEADVPHLRALVADADRVWLVYSHEWYTDPDGIIRVSWAR
ncbi:MAG: hypothetical protein R2838_13000 [Caldilineaceae bacterium]